MSVSPIPVLQSFFLPPDEESVRTDYGLAMPRAPLRSWPSPAPMLCLPGSRAAWP